MSLTEFVIESIKVGSALALVVFMLFALAVSTVAADNAMKGPIGDDWWDWNRKAAVEVIEHFVPQHPWGNSR